MRQLKTNCPNCGAVLKNGQCEYCGTKVQAANELDILCNGHSMENIELTLNIKQDGNIYVLPLIGRINDISIYSEEANACDALGHVLKSFVTGRHVDFTFSGSMQ